MTKEIVKKITVPYTGTVLSRDKTLKILYALGGVLVGSRALMIETRESDWDIVFTDKDSYDIAKMVLEKYGEISLITSEEVISRRMVYMRGYVDSIYVTHEETFVVGGDIDLILSKSIWSPCEQMAAHLTKELHSRSID